MGFGANGMLVGGIGTLRKLTLESMLSGCSTGGQTQEVPVWQVA